MRAYTHHRAVVENDYLVCLLYSGYSLRNEEYSNVAAKRMYRLSERRVGRVVERAGAVVENEYLGLFYQRARN